MLESLRELERWRRSAAMVLGDMERPRRLPSPPGEPEVACPFCKARTLRMWALQGIVRCVNPNCSTPGRLKAVARLEYSAVAGMSLVWQDGSVL